MVDIGDLGREHLGTIFQFVFMRWGINHEHWHRFAYLDFQRKLLPICKSIRTNFVAHKICWLTVNCSNSIHPIQRPHSHLNVNRFDRGPQFADQTTDDNEWLALRTFEVDCRTINSFHSSRIRALGWADCILLDPAPTAQQQYTSILEVEDDVLVRRLAIYNNVLWGPFETWTKRSLLIL